MFASPTRVGVMTPGGRPQQARGSHLRTPVHIAGVHPLAERQSASGQPLYPLGGGESPRVVTTKTSPGSVNPAPPTVLKEQRCGCHQALEMYVNIGASAGPLGLMTIELPHSCDTLSCVAVRLIVPGQKAWVDGRLRSGDILFQVGDVSLVGMTQDEVVMQLRVAMQESRATRKRHPLLRLVLLRPTAPNVIMSPSRRCRAMARTTGASG